MIHLVQGDDVEIFVYIKNVGTEYIQEVTLKCPELNIMKVATYDEEFEGYSVKIPKAETRGFAVGLFKFSVTIVFADGQKITPVPKDIIEVLKKREVLG